MMQWYYAVDGQQRGPVSEAEFEQLVQSGVVGAETLVWREGMASWQPRGQLPGAGDGAGAGAAGSGGMVCSQCGRSFAPEEVIRYEDRWICASCKPLFLQQLREQATPTAQPGEATLEQLLSRDYTVEVGSCIREGWEGIRSRFGLVLGASVLVYLANLAAGMVPFVGFIISIILGGPLFGGIWMLYLKVLRREDALLSDAFSGFGPRFGQLALVYIVVSLLAVLCFLPVFGLVVYGIVSNTLAQQGGGGGPFQFVFPASFVGILVGVGLVCAVPYIYLMVGWMFAAPLVIDKRMGFWAAMTLSRRVVVKHFWATLLLLVVLSLLSLAGVLACLVGLLFTGPVAFAALARHYERVFGDLQPEVG